MYSYILSCPPLPEQPSYPLHSAHYPTFNGEWYTESPTLPYNLYLARGKYINAFTLTSESSVYKTNKFIEIFLRLIIKIINFNNSLNNNDTLIYEMIVTMY